MNLEQVLSFGKEVTELGFILTAVYACILFVLAKIALRIIHKMTKSYVARRGKSAETMMGFVYKIVKVFAYGIVIYLVLTQFKALRSLGNIALGASSVVGVAMALACQQSIANLVGGFFLSMYQPIRVNDLIFLTEHNITGRVKEIGTRHTVLVTFNNTEIIIPNSVMNTTIIENRDINKQYYNFLTFSISYDSDVDLAMKLVQELALNHPLLLDVRNQTQKANKEPNAKVIVSELGSYSIQLRLGFNTSNINDGWTMSADLRKSVLSAFKANGIQIPYPITQIIQKEKMAE